MSFQVRLWGFLANALVRRFNRLSIIPDVFIYSFICYRWEHRTSVSFSPAEIQFHIGWFSCLSRFRIQMLRFVRSFFYCGSFRLFLSGCSIYILLVKVFVRRRVSTLFFSKKGIYPFDEIFNFTSVCLPQLVVVCILRCFSSYFELENVSHWTRGNTTVCMQIRTGNCLVIERKILNIL